MLPTAAQKHKARQVISVPCCDNCFPFLLFKIFPFCCLDMQIHLQSECHWQHQWGCLILEKKGRLMLWDTGIVFWHRTWEFPKGPLYTVVYFDQKASKAQKCIWIDSIWSPKGCLWIWMCFHKARLFVRSTEGRHRFAHELIISQFWGFWFGPVSLFHSVWETLGEQYPYTVRGETLSRSLHAVHVNYSLTITYDHSSCSSVIACLRPVHRFIDLTIICWRESI